MAPEAVTSLSLISPVGLVADAVRNGDVSAFHRFCFGPLAQRPALVRAVFATYRRVLGIAPGLACRATNARAPAVDRTIMADCATSQRLLTSFKEGLSGGAEGPAIDLSLFREIDRSMAARVVAPTRVISGTDDTNVPAAAALELAAAIKGACLDVKPGVGHLWVAQNYADVLKWVARHHADATQIRDGVAA
jgi:pimeloyl-ACP methyl ester carboxylesterase